MAGELIYSSNTNNTGNISTLQCAEIEVSVLVTSPPLIGGNLRVYIDDVQVDSVSISSSNNTYSNSFTSGGNIRVELTASFGSTSGDIDIFCVFPPKDLFKLGDTKPKNVVLGNKNVLEIRKGDNLVWEGFASPGQVEFTEPGTYQWTVPKRVKRVSAVAVGAGGGNNGGGGGLAYDTFYVEKGDVLDIVVGSSGTSGQGGSSSIENNGNILIKATGGLSAGDNRFRGTNEVGKGSGGGLATNNSAGGAAGYSGFGGTATTSNSSPGQGGGGGSSFPRSGTSGGGGGGVGIYGEGGSGAGGDPDGTTSYGRGGRGGSGGQRAHANRVGGNFGGGGGTTQRGSHGAVRIIWGNKEVVREYPSTNTEDY